MRHMAKIMSSSVELVVRLKTEGPLLERLEEGLMRNEIARSKSEAEPMRGPLHSLRWEYSESRSQYCPTYYCTFSWTRTTTAL